MSTDRKTSNDYRKEYKEIKASEKSLNSHLNSRIVEILNLHTDLLIENGIISFKKEYLLVMTIETRLKYLESIEKCVREKEKIVQTKIIFPS
jgi:hypothetical protein